MDTKLPPSSSSNVAKHIYLVVEQQSVRHLCTGFALCANAHEHNRSEKRIAVSSQRAPRTANADHVTEATYQGWRLVLMDPAPARLGVLRAPHKTPVRLRAISLRFR